MCGISGIFHQQYHDSHLECVQTMVQYMKHRGPDAQNTLVVSKQPEVIFGHDRFSIFDLSPQAAQVLVGKGPQAVSADQDLVCREERSDYVLCESEID